MTISEAIKFGNEELEIYGIELSQLESEILLAYSLNVSRESLYLEPDMEVETSDFVDCIKRRSNSEPIAYITGSKEFYGRNFVVDSNVLIPRPDTETLIDEVIKIAKFIDTEPINILDIGCGSGNISLTLNKEILNSSVIGLDISQDALNIAKKNKEILNCPDVEFVKSDLMSSINLQVIDIIVANLPYVPETEKVNMQDDVLKYEPLDAIFGGRDGLEFYYRLIDQIIEKKIKFNAILFEIFPTQYLELKYYFEEKFPEYKVSIVKDLGGRDRVFIGRKAQ